MSQSEQEGALSGVSVLVTRPAGQAQSLCYRIESAGGHVFKMPLLQVQANPSAPELDLAADLLIFVSPAAVEFCTRGISKARITGYSGTVAAPGPGTARRLREAGFRNVMAPGGASNSEELVKSLASFPLAQRRVLIVRGQSGRELLADRLRECGAQVEYLAAYRRSPAPLDENTITAWLKAPGAVALITSVDALLSLVGQADPALWARLARRPLLVPGDRVAAACREQAWQGAVIAMPDPGEEVVVSTLMQLKSDGSLSG